MTDEDRCYWTAKWGGGERLQISLYAEIEEFIRKFTGAKIVANKGYWDTEAVARQNVAGAAVHRFVKERYERLALLSAT